MRRVSNPSDFRNTSTSEKKSTRNQFNLAPFHVLIRKRFRHQHDMRRLILSALFDSDKDDVVKLLAEQAGIEKLIEILQAPFTLDAGSASQRYSFQRVAVPLCFLLSNPDFRNSVRVSDVIKIYEQVLREYPFFLRCSNLIEDIFITRSGEVTDYCLRVPEISEYHPSSPLDIAESFLSMCHKIILTVHDSRSTSLWKDIIPNIGESVNTYITKTRQTGKQAQNILRVLDRLTQIIGTGTNNGIEKAKHQRLSKMLGANDVDIKIFINEGPGSQRKEGPRNNNDIVNFREVQIIPTESEVTCTIPPYLPFQTGRLAESSNCWIADDVERHLDIQFRLMREDMIAPLRGAVQHFFLMDVMSKLSVGNNQFKFGENHHNKGHCYVFRNTRVEGVSLSPHRGLSFRISFDQVFTNNGKKARERLWNSGYGSNMLQSSTIVCLVFNYPYKENGSQKKSDANHALQQAIEIKNSKDIHFATQGAKLVFAFVHSDGRNQLGEGSDRCYSLHLQPVSPTDQNTLLEMINSTPAGTAKNVVNVMLQVRGHFVAGTVPVLKSLQESNLKDLPWIEKIVKRNSVSITEVRNKTTSVKSPGYVSDATRYDLSFLATAASSRTPQQLRNVVLRSYEDAVDFLRAFSEEICLDDSQIEAFVTELLHEVGIIQGPPGCGKTYIGVKIMQALLTNSSGNSNSSWFRSEHDQKVVRFADEENLKKPRLHPILCICYTNHALDQFLEALIDTKAVQLEDVVRMGRMSKNEDLKNRELERLARLQASGRERYAFHVVREECEKTENQIKKKCGRPEY